MTSFNSLPYELRFKIWVLALPIDRKVTYPYPTRTSKNENPALLSVNRESRELAQKYYTTLAPNSLSGNEIHYVDWENDIFEFPMSNQYQSVLFSHRYNGPPVFEFEKGGVEDIFLEELAKMERLLVDRTHTSISDGDSGGYTVIMTVNELGAVNLKEIIFKTHVGYRHLVEREHAGFEGGGDVSEEVRKKGEWIETWLEAGHGHPLRRRKGYIGLHLPRVTLKGCDVGCVSCGSRARHCKDRKSTRNHRRKVVKERVARKREELGKGSSKGGDADRGKDSGTSSCGVSFDRQTTKPNLAFTNFPKLAAELREQIWLFALPPRKIIYSRKDCEHYLLGRTASHQHRSEELRNPTLLFVNQESRHLALKHYSLRPSDRDDGEYAGKMQYLDYANDIFEFHGDNTRESELMRDWTESIVSNPWIGHELAQIERLQIVHKNRQRWNSDKFQLNLGVKIQRGVRHFKELAIVVHSGARFRVVGGRDRIRVDVETLTGTALDKSIKKEIKWIISEHLDFKTKNHDCKDRWKDAILNFKPCKDCVDCKKLEEGYLVQRHNRWKRREETKERENRKKRGFE